LFRSAHVGPLDVRDRGDLERVPGITRPREQIGHLRGGGYQVRVDGRAMVRVALRTAAHLGPGGDEPCEQTHPVEHIEHRRATFASAEQPEERGARAGVPRDAIGDGHILDRIQQPCRRDLVLIGHVGERLQDRRRVPGIDGTGARGSRHHPRHREPGDVLDVPGVFEERTHQSVGREQIGLVDESHPARDVRLELRHQPVGAPPGQQLDRAPGADEERLGGVDRRALSRADDACALEVGPERRREPPQRGRVAEPAAPLLEIGFQELCAGSEPVPARAGRVTQPAREPGRVLARSRPNGRERANGERLVAHDDPPVQHRRPRVEPLGGREALRSRPHRVPQGEPRIPQRV